MDILVTGGCGFIGVNLVREASGGNHRIRVLDNLSVGRREDLDGIQGLQGGGQRKSFVRP